MKQFNFRETHGGSVKNRNYSQVLTIIHCYAPIFATIYAYTPLQASIFTVFHNYSFLFTIIHHYPTIRKIVVLLHGVIYERTNIKDRMY